MGKKIGVIGVGRSSHYLFDYLNRNAAENGWTIVAADLNINSVQEKIQGMNQVVAQALQVEDSAALSDFVTGMDIIVSLLPPTMHTAVAAICLEKGKHLATASYVSDDMKKMHTAAKEKGLTFINELGLDPGIDHLSAMKIISELRAKGAEIFSFESYCGGLVHTDDTAGNPWQYKFSWNPMNVILAGQGAMSMYKENNVLRCIPWHQVFADMVTLDTGNYGAFDAYPNRDSLSYAKLYALENATHFKRGTLRRLHFCAAWQVLVKLGFTENTTTLPAGIDSPAALVQALTGKSVHVPFSDWLIQRGLIDASLKTHFDFLDLDNRTDTILTAPTAAGKLLQWLETKWFLEANDRDEVVMFHRFGYRLNGEYWLTSKMKLTGVDGKHTAMAKTVGLPLAIGVEAVLNEKITERGVCIPISPAWFGYVLPRLEREGVVFEEEPAKAPFIHR